MKECLVKRAAGYADVQCEQCGYWNELSKCCVLELLVLLWAQHSPSSHRRPVGGHHTRRERKGGQKSGYYYH